MIASRVLKESELKAALKERGFVETKSKTSTGTMWKHRESGKHIQVPFSVQGHYPDWLLSDLEPMIGKIRA